MRRFLCNLLLRVANNLDGYFPRRRDAQAHALAVLALDDDDAVADSYRLARVKIKVEWHQ